MKRDLKLRDYQIPAAEHIKTSKRCVLAIAPNGGKTEISIKTIEDFLEAKTDGRVLVLTHSTNVLLENYYDRLESINVSFTYSKTFDPNAQVHVCLPNNEKHITQDYDYIIVDEAHENYLATRVQRIVKKSKPMKQLLLTGTPSKFIAEGGYDVYAIAANEISDEWFAKLNIELVASNYKWVGNYNHDNEVKTSFKWNTDDTEKTLELVLARLIQRLATKFTPKEFNHPSLITKFKSWAFTYNEIGKTMIVCKRIEQAEATQAILLKNGVNSVISHSECDKDGEAIQAFKDNKHNVLVVVNRGKLGYNDDDLMNLIDMSGTHNPDMIYQMFCRVVRGTPDTQKFYMKVTPKELHNMSLTHISVSAALMLTVKEYLSIYNGKNFNTFKIPILKSKPRYGGTSRSGTSKGKGSKKPKQAYLPEFTHDVIDTLRNVLHNLDNDVSIYKMTTIGEAKYILGHTKKRPPLTVEQLFESAMGNLAHG